MMTDMMGPQIEFQGTGGRRSRGPSAPVLLATFAAAAIGLATSLAWADVIYLKNGRKIVANVSHEDSKQVYYELAGSEIAIARSLIDRIEKSPLAAPADAAPARERQPALPPPAEVDTALATDSPAVKEGTIDQALLRRLDDDFIRNPAPETRARLKRGYQDAAVVHTRSGDAEAAIEDYRHALKVLPDDRALTLGLGYLLIRQNHHLEATGLLLPAVDRHPQWADLYVLLGSAYYGLEDLPRAIDEWNKALGLRDDARLREAVAKAQHELTVSGSYQELRSEHFLLRYEGDSARADTFGGEVLKTLNTVFLDLERDLDFYPQETIVVLLYPNQAFSDITRLPSWVGAANDGKIRVPISGLTSMTPDVARVLKHELTHSFVRQMTLGHCPTWFNEGLAQLEEGATTAAYGTQLGRAFSRLPAYSALEGTFMSLPQEVVGLTYAKSLAALEYLRDTQGLGEIQRLLKAMPGVTKFAGLLQDELRVNYAAFEQEVGAYVEKRYGSQ